MIKEVGGDNGPGGGKWAGGGMCKEVGGDNGLGGGKWAGGGMIQDVGGADGLGGGQWAGGGMIQDVGGVDGLGGGKWACNDAWVMMLTIKDYGRPSIFDGEEEHWADWAFAMRAYLLVAELASEEVMEKISQHPFELSWDDVPDDQRDACLQIFYSLAMLVRGKATTKTAPDRRGPAHP